MASWHEEKPQPGIVDRIVAARDKPTPPPTHPLPVRAWRNPMFIGWCRLCGEPVNPDVAYCRACRWAAGL